MYSGLSSPTIPLVFDTAIDLNSLADAFTFAVPFKCRVVRAALVMLNDVADAGTVKFDKIPKNGGIRGDGDVASFSLTTAHTAGKYVYDDPSTDVSLEEGDLVVVEVTNVTGAGDLARAVLLVREIPEVAGNNTGMVASA